LAAVAVAAAAAAFALAHNSAVEPWKDILAGQTSDIAQKVRQDLDTRKHQAVPSELLTASGTGFGFEEPVPQTRPYLQAREYPSEHDAPAGFASLGSATHLVPVEAAAKICSVRAHCTKMVTD
jgi:hypothetical protein